MGPSESRESYITLEVDDLRLKYYELRADMVTIVPSYKVLKKQRQAKYLVGYETLKNNAGWVPAPKILIPQILQPGYQGFYSSPGGSNVQPELGITIHGNTQQTRGTTEAKAKKK